MDEKTLRQDLEALLSRWLWNQCDPNSSAAYAAAYGWCANDLEAVLKKHAHSAGADPK